MGDDQLDRVARPLREAMERMRAADTALGRETEVTNVLSQAYRLDQLARSRWGAGHRERMAAVAPGAHGLGWARQFDTHELLVTTRWDDVWSDTYDDFFGRFAWRPVDEVDEHKRHRGPGRRDYADHLAEREVLPTVGACTDALIRALSVEA